MPAKHFVLIFVFALPLFSQQTPDTNALLQSVLQRMDTLEQQNRQLAQELHELREQLAAGRPKDEAVPTTSVPLDERVAVAENRIDEQAQTKVEAAHKMPISITGQLLFNAFSNTGNLRALPDSVYSPFIESSSSTGATVQQTMIGFDFNGPSLPGDGKVNAHMMLDFYPETPSQQLQWIRMRSSDISFDWRHRSVTFAFDKPLISPRQPESLSEVSIPPLAGSGNLWLWLPQVRYEERFNLGNASGINVQTALLETDETLNYVPAAFAASLEKSRPAFESRVGIWRKWNDRQHLELATGFHSSTTHVASTSVDSRIFSVDWLAAPFSKLQISGTWIYGQNFASLGALSNGFSFLNAGVVTPVHSAAGWTQFSVPVTNRRTFNAFGGFQDNRTDDVEDGDVSANFSYAGNLIYHISQNVAFSVEALQMRTRLKQDGDQIRNRYDLAVAYFF